MNGNHRINGTCEICKEPMVKGDNTRWNNTDHYYCCACTIMKNRQSDLKDILLSRREELFSQLGEITFQLKQIEENEVRGKISEEPDIDYCSRCDDYTITLKGFICKRCGLKRSEGK